MCVYRNTAARSRNNFAVATQHGVLCVAQLDDIVNHIKIFSDALQCLMVNFMSLATMQNYTYLPAFEKMYIFQLICDLFIHCTQTMH